MPVCSDCGEENPDRARFCLTCGPHPQDTIYIADRNNTVLAIVDRPTKGKGETTISYTKARSSQRAKDRIMSCVIR